MRSDFSLQREVLSRPAVPMARALGSHCHPPDTHPDPDLKFPQFSSTRFSPGNLNADNSQGYVSVPGYGPVDYRF